MNAKRKPTKAVRVWMLIDRLYPDYGDPMLFSATNGRMYRSRKKARAEKFSFQRIARVEIREVGR